MEDRDGWIFDNKNETLWRFEFEVMGVFSTLTVVVGVRVCSSSSILKVELFFLPRFV